MTASPPRATGSRSRLLRKHGTTIALVVAAAGLGVWAYVDRDAQTTSEAELRRDNLLGVWRAEDVYEVSVTLPDGSYRLSRARSGEARPWSLATGDETLPAEVQTVDRYLGTLEFATSERRVPEASIDRAAFGLDAPRTRIEVAMGDVRHVITVGGESTAPSGRYVEVQGRGVFVISPDLATALELPADELRARGLVPYVSPSLVRIELAGEGGRRLFERAPWSGGRGSGFRFAAGSEGPVGRRAEGNRFDQVLVSLGRLAAERFLTPEVAARAGAPRVTLTLVPGDGPSATLEVGAPCPGSPGLVVVRRTAPTPLDACVPESVMPALVRPAADFEDRGLLGATTDEMTEVRVDVGGKRYDLVRKGGDFRLRTPEEREVPSEVGRAFLDGLVGARGEPAPSDTPDPEPEVTMRVLATGGMLPTGGTAERTEEVVVGPLVDGKRLVLRKEDGAKLFFAEDAAHAVTSAPLLLRDRQVLDVDDFEVAEVTITQGTRKQRFEPGQSEAEAVWHEPKVLGLGPDPFLVRDVVGAVSSLRAVRWVSESNEPAFGLSPGRIVIEARITGAEPRKVRLALGAPTDDGPYARLDDGPVFVAPARLERAVSKWLLDTTRFAPRLVDVERVVARRGAATITLTRDGKRLVGARDGGPLGAELTAELREGLDGLKPLEVVSVGAPPPEQGLAQPVLTLRLVPIPPPAGTAAPEPEIEITVGAGDALRGASIRYVRRTDVDATFALPESSLRALLGAFGE